MNRFLKKLALGILLALPWIGAVSAQQVNLYCWVDAGPPIHWAPCSSTNPLPISGGTGGGAATIANGADVAEGSTTDVAATAGSTGTISAKLRLMTTQLGTINTTLGTPFQAGGSIGNTTFAATQGTSPWVISGPVNVTPADCSGTIASGTTAQNAFTAAATRHGFTLANIDTSEVLWFSMTTTAAASGTGSYPLAPATATTFAGLSSFTSPLGMGINTALSVVAATTAHKYSCTVY